MLPKTLLKIGISFTCSVSFVIALYFFSEKVNHAPNGFIRLFRPHTVLSIKSIDLGYKSYYFAGVRTKNVYLSAAATPFFLLGVNSSLADTQQLHIIVADSNKLKLKSAVIEIDSPLFFIKDGIQPAILDGKLADLVASRNMYDSTYFTAGVSLGTKSFALRTSRNNVKEYILAKQQDYPPHINFVAGLLQNQLDGFFSTDGMLLYNKQLKRLLYIYYYRNQFLCMDSNLALLYRGKTIDTTSWAKIKITAINNGNTIVLNGPPLLVNDKCCTYGTLIFIHSKLLANNEDRQDFNQASVIDVYNIADGRYKCSFYIYDFANEKLKDIIICDNILYSIHDHYLVASYLDPKLFS